MDIGLTAGVIAMYLCFIALAIVGGGWLVRDYLRHFHILRTAKDHGLEPVGMFTGNPVVVIGIALAPQGARAGSERFAGSTLCVVRDGRVERIDSEELWSMKRSRRLVWYGLLWFTGAIGRDNFVGFSRCEAVQRRVPAPAYRDLELEQSMLLERVLPLLVTVLVLGGLYFYALR